VNRPGFSSWISSDDCPGKSADFLVLDANPLDDIRNVRRINKVFLRGQEVDRAGLRAKWQARWNKATD